MLQLPTSIRKVMDGDLGFLIGEWIQFLGCTRPWGDPPGEERPEQRIDRAWFCAAQRALCGALLHRSEVLVACNPEDAVHIYGIVVYELNPRILHWLFVKSDFRNQGVGTRLMRAAFGDFRDEIIYTVRTRPIRYHEQRWHLRFDSRQLMEGKR